MAIVIKRAQVASAPAPAPAPKGKIILVRKNTAQADVTQRHKEERTVTPEPVPFSPTSERYYPSAINCTRPARPLDGMFKAAQSPKPSFNNAVSWFIMASYCYYILDHSLITDGLYDELAKVIDQNWDTIDHPHKKFIKREELKAGSLFSLPRIMYPSTAVGGLTALIKGEWGAHW